MPAATTMNQIIRVFLSTSANSSPVRLVELEHAEYSPA